MITDGQIRYLKTIVDTEFDLDILDKCRKAEYVNARLIYSYILRRRGVGLVRIAKSIDKNHATILYLVNNAPFYLKQDQDLEHSYENCLRMFENHYFPVIDYTRRELLNAYLKLDSQYDMGIEENQNLIEQNLKLKKTIEELELSKNY